MTITRLVVLLLMMLSPASAGATNSRAELEQVLEDIMNWLPGEYSTLPQIYLERTYGTPPDGEHDTRYRIFAKVDVPHIGSDVIYGQTHEGGPDGRIVPGSQVLYIATINEELMAVNIQVRRVKDFESYEFAHLDPEKQRTMELDPDFGGNCDFRWQRHGTQLVGRLAESSSKDRDGVCTLTSRISGLTMTWQSEWMLNPWELWVYDNGYKGTAVDESQLFQGRHDRTYTRYSKVRPFTCNVTTDGEEGTEAVKIVTLHDRGGEFELIPAEDGTQPRRLALLRSVWVNGSGGMSEHLRLFLYGGDVGSIIGETTADPLATSIDLAFDGGLASCAAAQPPIEAPAPTELP